MKKHLLFYLLFVLLAINARAQQNTVVTIGTGIAASKSNGPIVVDPAIVNGSVSKHIGLYLASEINATPFTARALTKIAWYKEDTVRHNTTTGGILNIYLKPTTSTVLPGGPLGVNFASELTGATLVYTVNLPSLSSGAGWKEFTLPTPVIWNGTSNLELLVEWFGPGPIATAINWRYSSVTGNRSATVTGPAPNLPGSGNLPNIQFTFTAFNNDGGISALNSPVSPVTPNVSTPVTATLKNFGSNPITTATIGWKVNGVSQPDYTWNGNLASGQTAGPIPLGNFTFPVGGHTLKAYTKTVNGAADPLSINDTTTTQLVACTTLAGNYTINKNLPASATNFQSFTSAAAVLNTCGVNGPVTITVAPGSGPYNESVSLINISGTSATNTVTFEGNGNTVSSANPAVVFLDRANYVKFNNLIINQTSAATLCYGVKLIGPSNNATISNCTINMPPNTTSPQVIGILIGDGLSSNTAGNYSSNSLFQNNIINGGYYASRINGLAVTGSSPIGAVNNRFVGNQFMNFYSNGIYMSNADGTKIEGNTFTRPTATTLTSFSGINVTTGSINTQISKNRFHNSHGAVASPTSGINIITVEVAAPVGSENIIRNNLFYNLNNAGLLNVINLFSATGCHVYHNTLSIENPNRPASNSSNIKAFNLSGTGANVKFVNNIVTINMPGTGTKHAIYLSAAPAATFVSNNNALHIASGQTNAFTGYLTSNRATLADWRAANTTAPFDMNSVDANPAFVSLATGNLKPTSPDVNNVGQPLVAVTDDILGVTRHATTPDPGAYEFDLGTNDAGITAFVSPTTPAMPSVSIPVTVSLKNFGSANLNSATIGWKVNGVMQPDYAWTGTVAPNATVPVTIGNYTFAAGAYTVCAWTKMPNGGTDVTNANDSTCTAINACAPLAGNYTINKNAAASATNFISFTAAAERLHSCGVSGKVTISVTTASGPYAEKPDLLNIPGTSATNRVIFEGNGNEIVATPDVQKATIIKLDNADYVKINNLKITMNGTGGATSAIFTAIQLVNNSDNDTISNCTISMPFAMGSNACYMGVFAGTQGGNLPSGPDFNAPGNNASNLVFINNTTKGGLYGIKINGNTGGTGAVNNRIIGNSILDAYFGIGLDNSDGGLVENNVIARPNYVNLLAGPFTYGFSLNGACKNNIIRKNRITNMFGGQAFSSGNTYGMYFSGTGAPVGSENIVSNNLIHDTNTPVSFYGIYNKDMSGVFYYHNTISSNYASNSYGFYQELGSTNVKFNNNIISITSSSGSLGVYGIFLSGTIETNNNVLYIKPGIANRNFGFYGGTSYISLATWKTANNNAFDQQSVDENPMFRNVNGNLIPSNPLVNNIGKPLPAVTTDMLNNARNAATPDPGAYEFTPSMADAAVAAISSPVSGCGLTSQETVTISIQNFASVPLTSVNVSFAVDGGTPVVETFTGSIPFNGTASFTFAGKANLSGAGSHRVSVKTILPGDTDPSNDTLSVAILNSPQLPLPVALNFETPATGIAMMKPVTNTNSAITEGAGASNGTGSTKGLIMDGVDHANWTVPGGTANPWTMNPENFAGAYICLSTANANPNDTLRLSFDLKQLFKASNANTSFRVTVNGTQVGPTYRPPFDPTNPATPIVWQKIVVDLSAYLTQASIQVGLESSVKEAYANGAGTANLIDNIELVRTAGPTTGVKDNALQAKVVVYPNPSNGLFNISLPKGKAYELTVSDLSGKMIGKQTATSGNAHLDLSGKAKGVYILRVSSAEGTAVRKLIVE